MALWEPPEFEVKVLFTARGPEAGTVAKPGRLGPSRDFEGALATYSSV